MNKQKENFEELFKLREELRVIRDHMARASQEVERALNKLGAKGGSWFFSLEDKCNGCGVTPTVGIHEIYGLVADLSKTCKGLFDQVDKDLQEPLVRHMKRGNRRGTAFLDGESCLLPLGPVSAVNVLTEPELPKIQPAPEVEQ